METVMPNHCINELIFRNVDAGAQAQILAKTCGADHKVDFNILVPAPLNMWWGSAGAIHERTFRQTHLEWARQNWGTKWNAYDHEPIEQTDDTLTLRFQTAWGPPYPWLAAVFNSLNLSFDHNWLSEGGAPATHGRFDMAEDSAFGIRWKEEEAADEMQRHLHKLLWGVEEFEDDATPDPVLGSV